ncbi:MAG: isochorismate synthase [Acidimicrobiales bacterium]
MTARPQPLVAVRLPLEAGPAIDPFGLAGPSGILFEDDGRILVGLGQALRLPLPYGLDGGGDIARAAGRLAAVACEDRFDSGTSGVMAFGALPFERGAPGGLVLPELVYGIEADGREWLTVVATDRDDLPAHAAGLRDRLRHRMASRPSRAGDSTGSAGVRISPRSTDDAFAAMVAESVGAITTGEVTKVVVSRQVDVQMGRSIDIGALLRGWHDLEPNCAVFSLPTPEGQFVGASPELLVDRAGHRVLSRPLAGTTDRVHAGAGLLPRELLASAKDNAEHRLVVDGIAEVLAPLCSDLTVPSHPGLVHLHTITHLGTSLVGTLAPRPDGTVPTALELVAELHPTPAVGGVPRDRALALIARLEPDARGYYAGPVGYVDSRGDGRWMLGLRAMTVAGSGARLTAGVGVVEGSRPQTELAETTLKLTAAFDALAPGLTFSTSTGPSTPSGPSSHEAVS